MAAYEKTHAIGRGQTMYGKTPSDVDSHNSLLGKCYVYEDIDHGSAGKYFFNTGDVERLFHHF